jgi:hypothetical protein
VPRRRSHDVATLPTDIDVRGKYACTAADFDIRRGEVDVQTAAAGKNRQGSWQRTIVRLEGLEAGVAILGRPVIDIDNQEPRGAPVAIQMLEFGHLFHH